MPRLSLLLIALLLLAGCATPATTARLDDRPARTPGARVEANPPAEAQRAAPDAIEVPPSYAKAVATGTRSPDGRPGPAYRQQATRYTLTARLSPDDHRLDGTARIVYTNHSPDVLPVLHLELAQNLHAPGAPRIDPSEVTGGMTLHRVAADGRTLATDVSEPPGYLIDGTRLLVGPAAPLAPGASITLEIDWSFTLPQAGAGGRTGYSRDDLLFLAYWYPQMAVYDDVYGWFTDPFLGRAEFYAGFADYDVTVDLPQGWIVAATGTLANPDAVLAPAVADRMRQAHRSDTPMQVVGPDDFGSATATSADGRLRWRFTASSVRDFAFSATRASIWDAARTPIGDRDGDGQPDFTAINTFYRQSAPRWKQVTRYQQHSISHHARYTGQPYPWPHMTAVEGADIVSGGMEYPMMTLIDDYTASNDSALYYVTAHELAHMWIPMIVGTNERRYSWIDEGGTTFLENQARADFFPGPNHEAPDRDTYLAVARAGGEGEVMRWSDFHYDEMAFTIASYSKPATLLATLRAVLGEDTFLQAYRTFIDDWAFRHPYPLDLFNTFERISGRDLDWFWKSWYYETWMLDQAVGGVTVRDGEATVTIENRGRAVLPVTVAVTYTDGTADDLSLPVDVWLGGASEAALRFVPHGSIARVEIDPAARFPDADRSNNVWTP